GGRPSRHSGNGGPGTLVTTRLKNDWRACSRAAWLRIVGGAKPARLVSTCAPTACPDRLRSSIDAATAASASAGEVIPTGSGAHIAATWLPSAPRCSELRTDTGTIAFST